MAIGPIPLLIMGGTGRIGHALRRQIATLEVAGLRPIWQSRIAKSGCLNWDILAEHCPNGVAAGVVLCLAGVVRGDPDDLAQNTALAMAACNAAAQQGARHVFLASSAAVYGSSDLPLNEQAIPAPTGAYGRAKLAMEQAALRWHSDNGPRLTILRIGNVAGFDALLGGVAHGRCVQLDPIAGQVGGPVRSYIGPQSLCFGLARLAALAAAGRSLPKILNVAANPEIKMSELLTAANIQWQYGPPNPAAIPKVALDIRVFAGLVGLPPSSGRADAMIAEWRGLNDAGI